MTAPTGRPRTHRPPKFTARRRAKFLETLAATGIVTTAAEIAGVSRRACYDARENDEAFALEWRLAEEQAVDKLETEAIRRAFEGVREPVFQGGKLVGHVQRYSDRLLEFLLSAHGERFRTKRVELTGANGGPLAITDEDADAVTRKLLPESAIRGTVAANGDLIPPRDRKAPL